MTETPAFLFYSQDFLIGTLTLPMEDRGKYITLLCCMHEHGRLTEDVVIGLVGEMSDKLRTKFKTDEKGLLYNQRLEKEIKDRTRFVKSRRKNASKKKAHPQPFPLGRESEKKSESSSNERCISSQVLPNGEDLDGAVKAQFISLGLSPIDAEYETLTFMAYYTGTGWKTNQGKPIINWKTAVTNWYTRSKQFTKHKQHKTLTELWLE